MNGISPFNYRKLTPEQEKRGEEVAETVLIVLCLIAATTFAIYIPFKPKATDLDAACAGVCILVVIVALRELWRKIFR